MSKKIKTQNEQAAVEGAVEVKEEKKTTGVVSKIVGFIPKIIGGIVLVIIGALFGKAMASKSEEPTTVENNYYYCDNSADNSESSEE